MHRWMSAEMIAILIGTKMSLAAHYVTVATISTLAWQANMQVQ